MATEPSDSQQHYTIGRQCSRSVILHMRRQCDCMNQPSAIVFNACPVFPLQVFIALLTFKMASPAGKDCKDPTGKVR